MAIFVDLFWLVYLVVFMVLGMFVVLIWFTEPSGWTGEGAGLSSVIEEKSRRKNSQQGYDYQECKICRRSILRVSGAMNDHLRTEHNYVICSEPNCTEVFSPPHISFHLAIEHNYKKCPAM